MADVKNNYYGNDTLEATLGERQQVRTRVPLYFGTNDVKGCLNGVFEIATNGADELNHGFGTVVKTIIEEDWDAIRAGITDDSFVVTVIDDGRGVPMDWNPKQKQFNWHLVYNQLFASGKRGSNSAYSGAAGLNGVGAAITQFTSEWMTVISRRQEQTSTGVQNIEYEMHFEDGEPKGELIKRPWSVGEANITGLTGTGTYVKYKTDPRFFLETRYNFEMIADRMRKLATVAGGSTFYLKYLDEEPLTLKFENGLSDFLAQIVDEPITKDGFKLKTSEKVKDKFMGNDVEYEVGVDVAFIFNNSAGYVECYNNGTYVPENGTHYAGAKDAIKDVLEMFGQREGKLDKREKILTGDLDDILCIICASTISEGEYCAWSGQDKRAINNTSLYNVFRFQITEAFRDWLTTHKEDGLRIIQAIKLRKEAREKADQIKKKLVKQMSASPNDLKTRPTKLTDCSCRDTTKNEIFIVEGDSAAGAGKTARSSIYQAIFALTGKILNCEKASPEQILNNRVIRELIQILGCGIDIKTTDKHIAKILKDLPKFDIKKLNYGRIVIMTDADLDGYHIACLLLVFFAKLMPELLRQGKVVIAQAPLFEVRYAGKNDQQYCYTDAELRKVLDNAKYIGKKVINVKRFKGLGEMTSDQLAVSTMEPATRRVIPVEFNDEEGFYTLMEELLGNKIDERKTWVREFFEMTTEQEAAAEQEYLIEQAYSDDEE